MYKAQYVEIRNTGVFARQDQFFIEIPSTSQRPRYFPITEREACERMKIKHDPRKVAQILGDAQRKRMVA